MQRHDLLQHKTSLKTLGDIVFHRSKAAFTDVPTEFRISPSGLSLPSSSYSNDIYEIDHQSSWPVYWKVRKLPEVLFQHYLLVNDECLHNLSLIRLILTTPTNNIRFWGLVYWPNLQQNIYIYICLLSLYICFSLSLSCFYSLCPVFQHYGSSL